MHNLTVREIPVGRGARILGAVFAAVLLTVIFYISDRKYGIAWPEAGWSTAFAVLLFTTYYVAYRDRPVVHKIEKLGVGTLHALNYGFVIFFLMFGTISTEFIETVFAQLWPLMLGLAVFSFAASLHILFFRALEPHKDISVLRMKQVLKERT